MFAGSKDDVLSTNHCSKTRLAQGTDPEIENLRRLSRLPLPIMTGNYFTPSRMGPSVPLSGQTITLTSPHGQSVTTKTDADGRFTFSSLAPATYQVKLTTPQNYAVDWRDHQRAGAWFTGEGRVAADAPEVNVSPSSCAEVAYTALPDGRISGYITDPQDRVPKSASLRIWPANQVDAIENSWWTQYPDLPGGKFELGPLHPGTYVIGTYIWPPDFEERSKDMNYMDNFVPQAWFYPGTTDKSKAKLISVGFAQHVSNLHFVVPTKPVPASSATLKPARIP